MSPRVTRYAADAVRVTLYFAATPLPLHIVATLRCCLFSYAGAMLLIFDAYDSHADATPRAAIERH